MRKLFLSAGLILIAATMSCTGNEQKKVVETEEVLECYRYENGNDTIQISTKQIGQSINGTLVYNLREKDKNTGTVTGTIKDSIWILDYIFQSEGVESQRQVVFKKMGNEVIEGFGEVEVNGDHVKFKDPDNLDFNRSIILKKVACN